MENKNSYSHILKYTSLFGGIQFLSILLGIVKTKLVAVILGPSGIGLISLFNSTINFIANSTNLGIAMSAVKNISEAYETGNDNKIKGEIAVMRSWCLLTAVFGTIICALFGGLFNALTFSWGDHTLHFICLSPIVGMLAITGGELAVLKATRHLRKIALLTILNIAFALFLSVPIYYFWGQSGIVPCLVLLSFFQMLLTVFYSYRLYPLHLLSGYRHLSSGLLMVKLGVAFVFAGIMTSGAEFIIRAYLNNEASLDTVGLYSAGYMIVMTYGGMVFSAMETDYFPRLSAASSNKSDFNDIVNKQSEVSLLLIAPLLAAFILFVPIILPLLYSGKFVPVIPMIQVAILALYIRAVKLPVAYISLAKGDSRLFLIVDGQYAIQIVIASILGFKFGGLTGIGCAITIVGLIDYAIILFLMHHYYGYRMSLKVKKYLSIHYPLGCAVLALTFLTEGWVYWLSGILIISASGLFSLRTFRKQNK